MAGKSKPIEQLQKGQRLLDGSLRKPSPRSAVLVDADSAPRPPVKRQRKVAAPSAALPAPHRPNHTQERQATPPVAGDVGSNRSATSRLEQEALSGVLWCPECQQLQAALPSTVPETFQSVEEYIGVFEPLLQEEAREGVRGTCQENMDNGKTWPVTVTSVAERPASGWYGATLASTSGRPLNEGGDTWRDGNFFVLTKSTVWPPEEAATEDAPGPSLSWPLQQHGRNGQQQQQQSSHKRAWGTLSGNGGGSGARPQRTLMVTCVVRQNGGRGGWRQDSGATVSVELRPACSTHFHTDPTSPCMQALLALRADGTGWRVVAAGNLVTSIREVETLARVPDLALLRPLLHPDVELACTGGQLARVWPREAQFERYFDHLKSSYDTPQLEAIEVATSHMADDVDRHNSPIKVLPFTLIQGPPGTGKSHTVLGILNSWHMIQYRRHQDAWLDAAREALASSAAGGGVGADAALLSMVLPRDAPPKPRILVCAPSNAATDELLERILANGFVDPQGGRYRPAVVRVGSEDAPLSAEARAVWTEAQIRDYTDIMDKQQWQERYQRAERHIHELEEFLANLASRLVHTGPGGTSGGAEGSESADLAMQAAELIHFHERRQRCMLERDRLLVVAQRFHGQSWTHFNARAARDQLEISFVDAAELVFTTLSSTGRNIFGKLKRGFDTLLIDEACQAAEVAALQPLIYGAQKVVLVGDPQQLPATVRSTRAKDVQMERSLFERLQQAGCPVKMLTVQYRMHPEIRQFPSNFFYNGRLLDGATVTALPPAVFYEADLLKPYVVFDVAQGRDSSANRSRANVMEAELAVALFWDLRETLRVAQEAHLAGTGPPVERVVVGVVTPYRAQRDLLRKTFTRWLGPEIAAEVRIETVDSFQGKQMDVVILSCVRAGKQGSGIGFLSDTRRLNVAITRARRALWILGHSASLVADPTWSALLADADQRGCVITDATADELVPQFEELKARVLQAEKQQQQLAQQPPPPPPPPPPDARRTPPLQADGAAAVVADPRRRSASGAAAAPAAVASVPEAGAPSQPRRSDPRLGIINSHPAAHQRGQTPPLFDGTSVSQSGAEPVRHAPLALPPGFGTNVDNSNRKVLASQATSTSQPAAAAGEAGPRFPQQRQAGAEAVNDGRLPPHLTRDLSPQPVSSGASQVPPPLSGDVAAGRTASLSFNHMLEVQLPLDGIMPHQQPTGLQQQQPPLQSAAPPAPTNAWSGQHSQQQPWQHQPTDTDQLPPFVSAISGTQDAAPQQSHPLQAPAAHGQPPPSPTATQPEQEQPSLAPAQHADSSGQGAPALTEDLQAQQQAQQLLQAMQMRSLQPQQILLLQQHLLPQLQKQLQQQLEQVQQQQQQLEQAQQQQQQVDQAQQQQQQQQQLEQAQQQQQQQLEEAQQQQLEEAQQQQAQQQQAQQQQAQQEAHSEAMSQQQPQAQPDAICQQQQQQVQQHLTAQADGVESQHQQEAQHHQPPQPPPPQQQQQQQQHPQPTPPPMPPPGYPQPPSQLLPPIRAPTPPPPQPAGQAFQQQNMQPMQQMHTSQPPSQPPPQMQGQSMQVQQPALQPQLPQHLLQPGLPLLPPELFFAQQQQMQQQQQQQQPGGPPGPVPPPRPPPQASVLQQLQAQLHSMQQQSHQQVPMQQQLQTPSMMPPPMNMQNQQMSFAPMGFAGPGFAPQMGWSGPQQAGGMLGPMSMPGLGMMPQQQQQLGSGMMSLQWPALAPPLQQQLGQFLPQLLPMLQQQQLNGGIMGCPDPAMLMGLLGGMPGGAGAFLGQGPGMASTPMQHMIPQGGAMLQGAFQGQGPMQGTFSGGPMTGMLGGQMQNGQMQGMASGQLPSMASGQMQGQAPNMSGPFNPGFAQPFQQPQQQQQPLPPPLPPQPPPPSGLGVGVAVPPANAMQQQNQALHAQEALRVQEAKMQEYRERQAAMNLRLSGPQRSSSDPYGRGPVKAQQGGGTAGDQSGSKADGASNGPPGPPPAAGDTIAGVPPPRPPPLAPGTVITGIPPPRPPPLAPGGGTSGIPLPRPPPLAKSQEEIAAMLLAGSGASHAAAAPAGKPRKRLREGRKARRAAMLAKQAAAASAHDSGSGQSPSQHPRPDGARQPSRTDNRSDSEEGEEEGLHPGSSSPSNEELDAIYGAGRRGRSGRSDEPLDAVGAAGRQGRSSRSDEERGGWRDERDAGRRTTTSYDVYDDRNRSPYRGHTAEGSWRDEGTAGTLQGDSCGRDVWPGPRDSGSRYGVMEVGAPVPSSRAHDKARSTEHPAGAASKGSTIGAQHSAVDSPGTTGRGEDTARGSPLRAAAAQPAQHLAPKMQQAMQKGLTWALRPTAATELSATGAAMAGLSWPLRVPPASDSVPSASGMGGTNLSWPLRLPPTSSDDVPPAAAATGATSLSWPVRKAAAPAVEDVAASRSSQGLSWPVQRPAGAGDSRQEEAASVGTTADTSGAGAARQASPLTNGPPVHASADPLGASEGSPAPASLSGQGGTSGSSGGAAGMDGAPGGTTGQAPVPYQRAAVPAVAPAVDDSEEDEGEWKE